MSQRARFEPLGPERQGDGRPEDGDGPVAQGRADGAVPASSSDSAPPAPQGWAESLLDAEEPILAMIGAGRPPAEVLDALCRMIEALCAGATCSVLLLDADGKALRWAATPSLPRAYRDAVEAVPVGPGCGSCGTAAHSGEVVVAEDIAADPLWERCREGPLAVGLRACWSVPIRSSAGGVLGTFGTFLPEPRRPAGHELRACRRAAHLAAGALERDRSEGMYRRIVEAANEGIWTLDADQRTTFVNARMAQMLGYTAEEMLGRSAWDFTFEEDRPEGLRRWGRRQSGEAGRGEFRLRRKDGTELWAQTSTSPSFDAEGRFVGALGMFADITGRKEAEEAARRQARLTGVIAENATTAIFLMDAEGRTTFMNPAAEAMTGYTLREAEGRGLHELVHHHRPDGSPFPMDQCPIGRHALARRELRGHEDVFIHRDGTAFPVRCAARPIVEGGSLAGIVLEVQDITEQRRAEEALRAGEERFRGLMEQAPFSIQVLSPDGRTLRVNRAWEELWGLTLDTLADYNMLGDPQLESKGILPYLRQAFAGEPAAVPAIEYDPNETLPRRTRHEDPRRWVSAVAYPLRDAAGRVREVVLVHEDITERRRAEEALRGSEFRFRLLADAMPQIVWVTRPDGYHEYYNRRWYEYIGCTPEECLGHGWNAPLHPDDRQRSIDRWELALRTGEPYEIEYRFRSKEGEYRWFLARAMPVRDDAGRIERWFGTCTDIEDMKRSEEAIREGDRRKDEFLATLAHELRNPLAPIRTVLHLMREPAEGGHEAERAMAERQVAHLARLIDDLMDVARISKGKLELHTEVVDLHTVVRQAIETARPQIEDRRHRLKASLPEGPIRLEADPTRLEQVFWNLLNNAAKYTEPGGRIDLSAEAVDGRVVVRVRDTGLGIAPEMLPHVFQMFVQVGDHRQYAQGGLGIGLGLVRTLVELHGGSITAHSEGPGTGSEFVVRLPVPLASPPEPSPPGGDRRQDSEGDLPRRRILIVDDNADAANVLAKLLGWVYGQEVRVAHDGPAGLEAAEALRPEVILLDIGLPGMDGHEVARRLRGRPETGRATLVALTGWGQESDRRRSREAGFDHHLVKPVDPDDLIELLRNIGPGPSPADGRPSP
ncbi:PAS domain S-box protein [Tautonia sp. JC769]|uniref:PAS domain S-box protein n=1 Tax=Tautonia sp. JC769 TaxID=3232135 RepID=UPI00345A2123